jgi:hypothetical protein
MKKLIFACMFLSACDAIPDFDDNGGGTGDTGGVLEFVKYTCWNLDSLIGGNPGQTAIVNKSPANCRDQVPSKFWVPVDQRTTGERQHWLWIEKSHPNASSSAGNLGFSPRLTTFEDPNTGDVAIVGVVSTPQSGGTGVQGRDLCPAADIPRPNTPACN